MNRKFWNKRQYNFEKLDRIGDIVHKFIGKKTLPSLDRLRVAMSTSDKKKAVKRQRPENNSTTNGSDEMKKRAKVGAEPLPIEKKVATPEIFNIPFDDHRLKLKASTFMDEFLRFISLIMLQFKEGSVFVLRYLKIVTMTHWKEHFLNSAFDAKWLVGRLLQIFCVSFPDIAAPNLVKTFFESNQIAEFYYCLQVTLIYLESQQFQILLQEKESFLFRVKPIFESHEMKATFDEYLQDWAKPTTSFFLQLSKLSDICRVLPESSLRVEMCFLYPIYTVNAIESMDEYATSLLFQGKLWCDHFGKHIDMSRLLQLLSDQVKALRKPRERVMKTLQTISRERNDAPAHKASNYKSTLERALKKVHNLINDPLSTSIQNFFITLRASCDDFTYSTLVIQYGDFHSLYHHQQQSSTDITPTEATLQRSFQHLLRLIPGTMARSSISDLFVRIFPKMKQYILDQIQQQAMRPTGGVASTTVPTIQTTAAPLQSEAFRADNNLSVQKMILRLSKVPVPRDVMVKFGNVSTTPLAVLSVLRFFQQLLYNQKKMLLTFGVLQDPIPDQAVPLVPKSSSSSNSSSSSSSGSTGEVVVNLSQQPIPSPATTCIESSNSGVVDLTNDVDAALPVAINTATTATTAPVIMLPADLDPALLLTVLSKVADTIDISSIKAEKGLSEQEIRQGVLKSLQNLVAPQQSFSPPFTLSEELLTSCLGSIKQMVEESIASVSDSNKTIEQPATIAMDVEVAKEETEKQQEKITSTNVVQSEAIPASLAAEPANVPISPPVALPPQTQLQSPSKAPIPLDDDHVIVSIRNPLDTEETTAVRYFRIARDKKIKKLLRKYCERINGQMNVTKLYWKGKFLPPTSSLHEIGLNNYDEVIVQFNS